ncbi:hypothetical protein ACFV5G_42405, partial [Streptomyces sp. NPDC059766]|uniref:hypothetical protein n=1 Tax=Streptomyces sp. NPDC059766 TaxID=3346940 RepID=UPI0036630355
TARWPFRRAAHRSKGLEWDVVAVPGLVTGAFPSDRPCRCEWGASRKPWGSQAPSWRIGSSGSVDTVEE